MNDFNNIILTIEEKLRYLETLSEYADARLLIQINNRINETNDLELFTILHIGITMNLYFKSLIETLKNKNILSAFMVFRSLVESFINLRYIMKEEQQKRSAVFALDDFKTQIKNVKTFKRLLKKGSNKEDFDSRLGSEEKCDEKLKEIEDEEKFILYRLKEYYGIEIKKSDKKIPKLYDRAINSGLQDMYEILYRRLCWITHLTPSGLKELTNFENNKYVIKEINIETETKMIIPEAYKIYLQTIKSIMEKFYLNIKQDFKIMEEIAKKLEK
jgi:hypothetical protein